ncbi:hypothetical protein [Paracoccus shandongensis]|uniref:hypothetical protein n=1 Tax=Paracoccus shandongensis TaxID=2816048 RepID=UPI001A8E5012|nr:hypothetical protein [Paracoccus shandongensis]
MLIVEFMRPSLTVDRDYINRYQECIDVLRSSVAKNTDLDFTLVSGLLVADKLDRRRGMDETLPRLAKNDMKALEWHGLLERAEAQWEEFLAVLVARAPEDERLAALHGRVTDSASVLDLPPVNNQT